jgi:hypothetical protein
MNSYVVAVYLSRHTAISQPEISEGAENIIFGLFRSSHLNGIISEQGPPIKVVPPPQELPGYGPEPTSEEWNSESRLYDAGIEPEPPA